MRSIQEVQEDIIDEFGMLDNKNDQYNYIIELGKQLPPFPEHLRIDDNLIKGCQSKVWLIAFMKANQMFIEADSDSTLVKGLVSLLVRVLSGRTPQEIMKADLFFISKIGLQSMLSMNRANGLASMIQQIKSYALLYGKL